MHYSGIWRHVIACFLRVIFVPAALVDSEGLRVADYHTYYRGLRL